MNDQLCGTVAVTATATTMTTPELASSNPTLNSGSVPGAECDITTTNVLGRDYDVERDAGTCGDISASTTRSSDPAKDINLVLNPEPTLDDHPSRTPVMRQTVPSASLILPLYLITLTTGLLDASTFSSFNVFASNQTGNAILLTLAAANSAPVDLHNTAASLGGFLACAFIAGLAGNRFGVRTRGWLLLSNSIQLFLLILLTLLTSSPISVLPPNDKPKQWITLFLLASSAGFQVSLAKTSGVQEIPTAMLTSPFVELLTDKSVHLGWRGGKNGKACVRSRNRRVAYIGCLMGGSLIGAYMHRYTGGTTAVLILSIALRVISSGQMLLAASGDI